MNPELAPKPPLGWNSWDCYGTAVTEEQVRANAEVMQKRLAAFGWRYVVVDIQWSGPNSKGHSYEPGAVLEMDSYGRLIPALNRFPSAKEGAGFRPLADYIHSLGLKFGIHIMRGIPKQAVEKNTPILNSSFRAADIADRNSICPWNPDMFGVNMKKTGSQDYYDSLFKLYAEWGVDFVKADDMLSPVYHKEELEAMSQAIAKSGREMILSLSPGGTTVVPSYFEHLREHAQMWRLSDDVWDEWDQVRRQFETARQWQKKSGNGRWPDLDMLPLGRLVIWKEGPQGWKNRLTRDEQKTLMTLWVIFRSPLMMGGDLPSLDDFTASLLTNQAVLDVNQKSEWNRELFHQGDFIAWTAKPQGSNDLILALFNLGEQPLKVDVPWPDLDLEQNPKMVDLWSGDGTLGKGQSFLVEIPRHGAGLYRIQKK